MSEHQPWPHDPDADPKAEPPRDDGERADALDPNTDLDADAVEDLDVHEDAEHVAGGFHVWEEEGQPQIE